MRVQPVAADQLSRHVGLRAFNGKTVGRTPRRELPQRGLIARTSDPQADPYEVRVGDRIDRLAGAELGDVRLWWVIADLNPGLDYLMLVPGTTIYLPSDALLTRLKAALQ